MPLAIFDLDNTLVDRAASFQRWAQAFVARTGLDSGEMEWLTARDGDGFTPRDEFIAALRERYGLREPVDVLVHDFREQIVSLIEPDPRVPEALEVLRAAGWRVAIATNGTTAQQWAKIRRTGLDRHADAIAVSGEVGVAKPDRRMFEVAARRCGTRLGDGGWMVGDCATRDIAGGQRAGLRTVWMRRGRTWDLSARAPDATADDVTGAVSRILTGTP
ncbi:MAG TPA: HAD family hydrolase [Rugosimonospora sp.]|nr:HAD family hydrolase [Rugosimonospora sp.]